MKQYTKFILFFLVLLYVKPLLIKISLSYFLLSLSILKFVFAYYLLMNKLSEITKKYFTQFIVFNCTIDFQWYCGPDLSFLIQYDESFLMSA